MVSTTQRQPASTLLHLNTDAPYYKWLVAGIILMASATQTFAGSSVTLAIPRLMATFGADLAAAQWVTTGFLITRTLVTPLLGWLGGIDGATADRAALGFIRRQMDIEVIAAGFHSSFFLACLCFVLSSLPMIWILNRRYRR